jgi:hypothetical protein
VISFTNRAFPMFSSRSFLEDCQKYGQFAETIVETFIKRAAKIYAYDFIVKAAHKALPLINFNKIKPLQTIKNKTKIIMKEIVELFKIIQNDINEAVTSLTKESRRHAAIKIIDDLIVAKGKKKEIMRKLIEVEKIIKEIIKQIIDETVKITNARIKTQKVTQSTKLSKVFATTIKLITIKPNFKETIAKIQEETILFTKSIKQNEIELPLQRALREEVPKKETSSIIKEREEALDTSVVAIKAVVEKAITTAMIMRKNTKDILKIIDFVITNAVETSMKKLKLQIQLKLEKKYLDKI